MIETRALVLRSLRYDDKRLIVEMLTEKEGCRSFAQRLQLTKRGSHTRTLFQPLSLLEISYIPTADGKLATLRQPQAIPWTSLPYEPYKTTISFFLAEFLRAALHTDPPSETLFQYIVEGLNWLDAATDGYSNFHLVFLMRLTAYFGCSPNLDSYRPASYFDLLHGEFTAQCPTHIHYVQPAEAQLLPLLLRMNYQTMHLFQFSGTQRSRLLEVLMTYYQLHLPNFPTLRSLPILKALFSD